MSSKLIFKNTDEFNSECSRLKQLSNTFDAPSPYGPISSWNVSNVTSLYFTFSDSQFNQPINNWNVEKVKFMVATFSNNKLFNQPLDKWNVTNVESMHQMFRGSNFNQDINTWQFQRLENMDEMFANATKFNQPLNLWNVSSVKNMNHMFAGAASFNQPLNSWNVSNVRYMNSMFESAKSFNQPLDQWDVSNVNSMREMFAYATSFKQAESLYNWIPKVHVDITDIFINSGLTVEQQYQILRRWYYKESQQPNYRPAISSIREELMEITDSLNIDFDTDIIVGDLIELIPDANANFEDYNQEAVEVHKGFNKININKYKELIGYNNQEPPTNSIVKYIKRKFEQFINNAKEETTDTTTSTSSKKRAIISKPIWNNTEKKNLKTKLNLIMNKLSLCTFFDNPTNNLLVKQTIDFVFRQPSIFIADYIKSYIENVTKAYESEYSDSDSDSEIDETRFACVKGMFEQFILSMVSSVKVIQTSSQNNNTELYDELLLAIEPQEINIEEYLNEWFQQQGNNNRWVTQSPDQRLSSLINFIKLKYNNNNIVKTDTEIQNSLDTLPNWNYYLERINAPGELLFGGKRRKRHTNKRRKLHSKRKSHGKKKSRKLRRK